MAKPDTDVGLSVWAVTCDALARGEQIFLLVPGCGGDISAMRHEEFWLVPDWDRADPQSLTDPYRDRMRALESLRHGDDRVRVKYFATAEYAEPLASPRHLRALDGDHTLAAGAVNRLFEIYGRSDGGDARLDPPGVSLLVLRVRALAEAVIRDRPQADGPGAADSVEEAPGLPAPLPSRWRRFPEPVSIGGAEPVVGDERFLSRKARLLQRTGAVRAV